MDPLIVSGDTVTPTVKFDANAGRLLMEGVAIPEDVREMFDPIRAWVSEYAENPQASTELVFFIEYMNTAATKMVFELGNMVSEIHKRENCSAKIVWQYVRGDLEMHELGEEMIEEFTCLTEIKAVDSI